MKLFTEPFPKPSGMFLFKEKHGWGGNIRFYSIAIFYVFKESEVVIYSNPHFDRENAQFTTEPFI